MLLRIIFFYTMYFLCCNPTFANESTHLKTLTVGTKTVPPFSYKSETNEWTGISIDLWKEIALKLGIKYEFQEYENTTELLKGVEAKKIDVAIAAITITPNRAKQVDFSNSIFTSGLGIAVQYGHRGLLGMIVKFFTANFFKVIGYLSALLLFVGFVVWLIERKSNPQFEKGIGGLFSGFWWAAVTMVTVGYGDKVPVTPFGRVFGVLWMFSSILTISTFTAAITTSLTTERIESEIRSKEDLLRVNVGVKAKEAPKTFVTEMGVNPIEYSSIHDGFYAILNTDIVAFVHDTPVLKYELKNDKNLSNSIAILPFSLREEEYGIAVQQPTDPIRRNDLREDINLALLELKESGKYSAIIKSYLSE